MPIAYDILNGSFLSITKSLILLLELLRDPIRKIYSISQESPALRMMLLKLLRVAQAASIHFLNNHYLVSVEKDDAIKIITCCPSCINSFLKQPLSCKRGAQEDNALFSSSFRLILIVVLTDLGGGVDIFGLIDLIALKIFVSIYRSYNISERYHDSMRCSVDQDNLTTEICSSIRIQINGGCGFWRKTFSLVLGTRKSTISTPYTIIETRWTQNRREASY
ncbi:hypothetical protein QE152_g32542 [Popillia japonica]|uniref:Uncharacterized protein n=1 Tax=Popillia japonica TaxID=7064 RepID=A0AAW1IYP2_POPJA